MSEKIESLSHAIHGLDMTLDEFEHQQFVSSSELLERRKKIQHLKNRLVNASASHSFRSTPITIGKQEFIPLKSLTHEDKKVLSIFLEHNHKVLGDLISKCKKVIKWQNDALVIYRPVAHTFYLSFLGKMIKNLENIHQVLRYDKDAFLGQVRRLIKNSPIKRFVVQNSRKIELAGIWHYIAKTQESMGLINRECASLSQSIDQSLHQESRLHQIAASELEAAHRFSLEEYLKIGDIKIEQLTPKMKSQMQQFNQNLGKLKQIAFSGQEANLEHAIKSNARMEKLKNRLRTFAGQTHR